MVLGPGWPGILLHEAVGHGLEGDFNRKGESAFAGLMGQRVASPGVTVVDDGTIANRRGSLTVDDEGTPTQSTTLIEDGILVGYMQDRQNARLMGMKPTGNGRRQSYAHIPMPRMTNTIMLSGKDDPAAILASVKSGIYAVSFGGGQVDITSGKFVFSCTEAYKIENGKIGPAIKGAMLIGNGPDALTRIRMIGNDMKLDPGIGTCGKNGQGVPVGVGQPTLRIDQITVGGTATASRRPKDRAASSPSPAASRAKDDAVVQAEGARLPELDLDRREAEARPVGRPGNLADGEFRRERGDRLLQREARFQRTRLLACPRADAAAARARGKIGVGLRGGDLGHRSPHPHLAAEALPVETERGLRVGGEFAALGAFEIREEDKALWRRAP